MKMFVLVRSEDVSGVSGTGIVAEGVQFSDGTVAMRWLRHPYSVAFYASIDDVERIHGHGGRTRIVWQCVSVSENDNGNGRHNESEERQRSC